MKFQKYRKYDVVYVNLGSGEKGVTSGIRPCVVMSSDRSNHEQAPQITVVPLTTSIKSNPVHAVVDPTDVIGYGIEAESDFLAEQIRVVPKKQVIGKVGFLDRYNGIREAVDFAVSLQLGLN